MTVTDIILAFQLIRYWKKRLFDLAVLLPLLEMGIALSHLTLYSPVASHPGGNRNSVANAATMSLYLASVTYLATVFQKNATSKKYSFEQSMAFCFVIRMFYFEQKHNHVISFHSIYLSWHKKSDAVHMTIKWAM